MTGRIWVSIDNTEPNFPSHMSVLTTNPVVPDIKNSRNLILKNNLLDEKEKSKSHLETN